MAQPTFVPITEADQVRAARRLSVPEAWVANRPGDLVGPSRPTGARIGTPGPDQGFALALAHRFEHRLELTESEATEDVLYGGAILASKRAGLLGRAPCIYDLEAAFELFGFLTAGPPEGIIAERQRLFRSVAHDYVAQRSLADAVLDSVLVRKPDELRARRGEWRSPLDDAEGPGEPQPAGSPA